MAISDDQARLMRQVDEAALDNKRRELADVDQDYKLWIAGKQSHGENGGAKLFEQRIAILKDQIVRLEEVLTKYKVLYTDVPLPPGTEPNLAALMPFVYDTLESALERACSIIHSNAIVWKIEATYGAFGLARADVEEACSVRKVPVYSFRGANIDLNANVTAQRKATRKAIEREGFSPILRTCELVERASLDGNGFVKKYK